MIYVFHCPSSKAQKRILICFAEQNKAPTITKYVSCLGIELGSAEFLVSFLYLPIDKQKIAA